MAAGVSIRIQALLLLLFCGAALAGVLYLAGEGHRQGLRADAAHQLEELAREIDHFGRHHLEDFARLLAESAPVREVAAGGAPADNHLLLELLETGRTLLRNHAVSLLYVMDQNGTVVGCTPLADGRTLTGRNHASHPAFTGAIAGRPLIHAGPGALSGRRAISFSSPMVTEAGRPPAGVVVLEMALDNIDRLLARFPLPVVLLVSRWQVVFASNRPEWLYRVPADLPAAGRRAAEQSGRFGGAMLSALPFSLARREVVLDGSGAVHELLRQEEPGLDWQLAALMPEPDRWPLAQLLLFAGAGITITGLSLYGLFAFHRKRELSRTISRQNALLQESNAALAARADDSERQRNFLRHVLQSLNFPFYVIDPKDHSIILSNTPDLGPPDAKRHCYELSHRRATPCSGDEHPCPLAEVLATGRPAVCEHVHLDRQGGEKNVQVHAYPVHSPAGELEQVIEFSMDITEWKRAEKEVRESRARFKEIFDFVQAGILIVRVRDRVILDANRAACAMIGAAKADIVGRECHAFVCPNDRHSCPYIDRGEQVDNSVRKLLRAGGGAVAILKTIIPFVIDGEECLLESFIDVSELKRAQAELERHKDHLSELVDERTRELTELTGKLMAAMREQQRTAVLLEASLRDKEVLLKEVHHRVKNNMQIISSLLKLHAREALSEESRAVLLESQNRIRAMSLIHEKLYRSEDLARINFNEYIRDLAANLFDVYRKERSDIALDIRTGEHDVFLGMEKAIPCGLIINEILTNTLKYAFPGRGDHRISVRFGDCGDDELLLAVGDNGVGIPADISLDNPSTLGLRLIRMLAEDQLEARVTLRREEGTGFELRFRREPWENLRES